MHFAEPVAEIKNKTLTFTCKAKTTQDEHHRVENTVWLNNSVTLASLLYYNDVLDLLI